MKRFVEGGDRQQATLLPACLDDYVTEDNPVCVIDVFIDELDLEALGFAGVVPEVTGRPCMAISTASNRAAGSSGRASATSS